MKPTFPRSLIHRPWAKPLLAWLFYAVASSTWGASAGVPQTIPVFHGEVVSVYDGDSIWVRPHGEERSRKLRISAIDAPEICQSHGVAARDALREHILGKTVTVRQLGTDVYRRPLVDVQFASEDVGAWMVQQGWAWSYRVGGSMGKFPAEEKGARAQGIGVFSDSRAEEPRLFRRRHGPCPRS